MGAIRNACWLALALCLCGCRVPPRAGDPTIQAPSVNEAAFRQQVIYLHVVGVDGAEVPSRAVERSVKTISKHLGRPIEVCVHEPARMSEEGVFGNATFPVRDQGRVLGPADVSVASPVHRLSTPDRGVLGVVGRNIGDEIWAKVIPLTGPEAILVAAHPGPKGGRGVTGYATAVACENGDFRTGLVVLHESVIKERSGFFVAEERLWEWTLTHEIGHVLGVPASNTHLWRVPGLGPHCTHPECVMYTGLDWRVVVSGLLRGWPLDFCAECTSELRAAREGSDIQD